MNSPVPTDPVLLVTGTGTDVGKTIVTAAVAAVQADAGARVAIVKPAQTGVADEVGGDLAAVRELSGVEQLHEFARYPDPLSPAAAARVSGLPTLRMERVAQLVTDLATSHDLVLVEGAGGLLVDFNEDHENVADLATLLRIPTLLVVHPDLGTLNHTALTLEAMSARGLSLAGLVIGSWPDDPSLACRTNVADLESLARAPLAGVLRSGSGSLSRPDFLVAARAGLAPPLGGRFDAADFRQRIERGMPDASNPTED